MAFQISPGVLVQERDFTGIIPSVPTSIGAIVAPFKWGPLNERVLIDQQKNLVERFGKPDNDNDAYWFTASNFLDYSNQLWVVNVQDTTTAKNAVANGTAILIENDTDYESFTATNEVFVAKYPGTLGNSLKVSVCPSSLAFANTAGDTTFYIGNTNISTTTVGTSTDISSLIDTSDTVFVYNGKVRNITSASNGSFVIDKTLNAQTTIDASSSNAAFIAWKYWNNFDSAPGTSTYVSDRGGANDEMHIIVIDEDGEFTGTPGTVLERFQAVSKASDAKTENGSSNYYVDVIKNSKYIRFATAPTDLTTNFGNTASGTTFGASSNNDTYSFTGGTYDAPEIADFINGYNLFENPEEVDISFILTSNVSSTVVKHCIQNIAEERMDCVVFVSPEKSDVVNVSDGTEAVKCVDYRKSDISISTSYAVMDCNWKYQYDKYNDVFRWIPLNGDIAGLCARTDLTNDPWWSPGGLNRGVIKNVTKLAWNPGKAERDLLYKNGVNPVVSFPGQGTVLYGDKTLLSKPSAFDRINVRRLFIVLEKAIAIASKYSLMEFNDEFTRSQFRNMVEPFLRNIQGRRGITDYRVICDSTNNPPDVVDRNEFRGDIWIKPARSINFITLRFNAVNTGVDFDEIINSAG